MISENNPWYGILDGDPRAFWLQSQHYSFYDYKDGRRRDLSYANRHLIVGSGKKIVLMTLDCLALFIWPALLEKILAEIERQETERIREKISSEAARLFGISKKE